MLESSYIGRTLLINQGKYHGIGKEVKMLEISESLHRATNKLIGTHLVSFVIRLDLGRSQLLVNLGLRGE